MSFIYSSILTIIILPVLSILQIVSFYILDYVFMYYFHLLSIAFLRERGFGSINSLMNSYLNIFLMIVPQD